MPSVAPKFKFRGDSKTPMKPTTLLILILTLILAGCSSAPKSTPASIKADNPEKAELTDKLENMTPEERAAYVQANQAEIQQKYSGANSNQPTTR